MTPAVTRPSNDNWPCGIFVYNALYDLTFRVLLPAWVEIAYVQ